MRNAYVYFKNINKVLVLFIGFKRAFNLVRQEILVQNLEAAGTRGLASSWSRYFLSDCRQVKVNNALSETIMVGIGVPQGSMLSADLSSIFLNYLLFGQFHGKLMSGYC